VGKMLHKSMHEMNSQIIKKSVRYVSYPVVSQRKVTFNDDPKRVVITSAASQASYALAFKIAKGRMLGPNQRVEIVLLDNPRQLTMIEGVKQELLDCNFDALHDVKVTSCAKEAFEDSDFNLLMTLIPKLSHMSISEWLFTNAKVYQEFGKAIDSGSKRTARSLIAKGPVCTNSLVL